MLAEENKTKFEMALAQLKLKNSELSEAHSYERRLRTNSQIVLEQHQATIRFSRCVQFLKCWRNIFLRRGFRMMMHLIQRYRIRRMGIMLVFSRFRSFVQWRKRRAFFKWVCTVSNQRIEQRRDDHDNELNNLRSKVTELLYSQHALVQSNQKSRLFQCRVFLSEVQKVIQNTTLRRGFMALFQHMERSHKLLKRKKLRIRFTSLAQQAALQLMQHGFAMWKSATKVSKHVEARRNYAWDQWILLRTATIWDAWVGFHQKEKRVLKFARIHAVRKNTRMRRSLFSGWLRLCLSSRASVQVQRSHGVCFECCELAFFCVV
jgi:hypothetical protein